MEEITITIDGDGLHLTKKTTLQKAGQIISFLGLDQNPKNSSPAYELSPGLIKNKRLQPHEIIISSRAKTYSQKIVALALYLQDELDQENFSPEEIKALLKKMGDKPGNFTRDLKVAAGLQFVTCIDKDNDQWALTTKGRNAVEEKFSDRPARKVSAKRKSSSSKEIRDEVKAMSLQSTIDELPDYHQLPTKADKILWLLEFADRKEISSLTPSEIEFMSSELRDRVETRAFTALNGRNMKKGFVSKTSAGFQIQQKGKDHLISLAQNN
ncbi:MAG TPA: hypothetical protein VFM02_00305 [Candidatus Paceibacterota bacterium]|nr:hypothetical protein [Candidatus Paceibacterota bacterium]